MIPIRQLGLNVADGCNRACRSCTHFAGYGHDLISVAEADRQMALWSQRLAPRLFILYGGEPCLNPDLVEIIHVAARHFPRLRLNTNGMLLHRHPGLREALAATNAHLFVSIYRDLGEDGLRPIFDLLHAWRETGVRIGLKPDKIWTLRYRGAGGEILPYDNGNPVASWCRCTSRWCFQLRDGRIYKCPHVAYLPMAKAKFPNLSDAWDLGLAYRPLEPSATDEEIAAFVERRAEPVCGLCPAKPEKARP